MQQNCKNSSKLFAYILKYILSLIYQTQKKITIMTYFKNCKSLEEIKQLFRKLAIENHPDKGGDTETMQAINSAYQFAIANYMNTGKFSQTEIDEELNLSEKYQDAINKIAGLEGINIELVGNWIWVTGNTFLNKETLKTSGFFYASKKQAWYFRSEEFKAYNRRKMDLEEIRGKYGSVKIEGKRFAAIA